MKNSLNDKIKLIYGDITIQKFDAIVNSANKSLMGGGGVDGAIHRAAGFELLEECEAICGCKEGEAKITKSYYLKGRGIGWIIHAVGPRWFDGNHKEEELLKSAYRSSLELAVNYKKEYVRQCRDIIMKYMDGLDYDKAIELLKEVVDTAEEYIERHPIRTIAFPSISTGIYRFPIKKGAKIAINTILDFLREHDEIEMVGLVCNDRETYEVYKHIIEMD